MSGRPVVLLVCLLVPLSGCMDDSAGSMEEKTGAAAEPEKQPEPAEDRFAVEPYALGAGPVVDETVWVNGTFAVGVGCTPLCPTKTEETPDVARHDLTDLVPDGLPARIEAEVASESEATFLVSVASRAPRYADRVTEPRDADIGRVVTLVKGPDETVGVVVRLVDANLTEVAYTLRMHVQAAPGVVQEGVPVEVPTAAPDAGLLFSTTARYGRAALLLYDGDDRFVGRLRTVGGALTYTPEGNVTGPYVVVPAAGSDAVMVETFGVPPEAPRMRLLDLERTRTEPVALSPGANTWSIQVDDHPLSVGIEVSGPPPSLSASLNTTLTYPDGTVRHWNATCTLCTDTSEWVRTWRVPMGDETLGVGTYSAEVRTDAAAGLEARGLVLAYLR